MNTQHKLPIESKTWFIALIAGGITYAIYMTIIVLIVTFVENESEYSTVFNVVMLSIIGFAATVFFSWLFSNLFAKEQKVLFQEITSEYHDNIICIVHASLKCKGYNSIGYLFVTSECIIFRSSTNQKDNLEFKISDIMKMTKKFTSISFLLNRKKKYIKFNTWRKSVLVNAIEKSLIIPK